MLPPALPVSLSHKQIHTGSSHLTREHLRCQCKKNGVEQMAAQRLKPPTTVPTNFPVSPPFHPLVCRLHPRRCARIRRRGVLNDILARRSCQRGPGSSRRPAARHKVSQDERGGGRSHPRKSAEIILRRSIFSPTQIRRSF